jgi:hypothetical protein
MGKARTNDYISQSFQDRIEVSLANISRKPTDKFQLVNVTYIPTAFKCELCGHEPCLRAFTIKNLETDLTKTIGSECIQHFPRLSKTNIDLAMGMMKRIQSIVRKMRRTLKKSLETEEYQNMPKEQKRLLIVKLFAKHQAIEALQGKTKRSLLDKNDVLKTIQDNPWIEAEDDGTPDEDEKPIAKKVASSTKAKKSAPVTH